MDFTANRASEADEDRSRLSPARLYKQQTLDLVSDRMSTHFLASNQLRLWFATLAYLLLERMRTLGLGAPKWRERQRAAYVSSC